MFDIYKYKESIDVICRELSLRRLDLVGSASRDDFSTKSDIDVLVTFKGDDSLFKRYFALKERLEEIFDRPVDVIEERAIRNPFIKKALEKDRIRIYGT